MRALPIAAGLAAVLFMSGTAGADRIQDSACNFLPRFSWYPTASPGQVFPQPLDPADRYAVPATPPSYPGTLWHFQSPPPPPDVTPPFDSCDIPDAPPDNVTENDGAPIERIAAADSPAVVTFATVSTLKLNNAGFTVQAGEPDESGVLTRSLWLRLPKAAGARRVVMHTFGSSINTVIAIYTNNGDTLTRITGNNDFAVPGVSTNHSLVQFEAAANTTYWVQVGGVANAAGDIVLSTFQFTPEGGLASFESVFNGRDYDCLQTTCPAPRFIVYNATAQQLTVTPSTTLPTRFTAPAPFSLAPGALSVQDFASLTSADSTVRTDSGRFVFSGAAGGAEVARSSFRATARMGGSPATDLATAILPSGRSGRPYQQLSAFMTAINTGSQPAIGCVIRARDGGDYKVSFQETNPATNTPIGSPDTPVNIPAGATKTFVFFVKSQLTELGDPTFSSSPAVLSCASQAFAFSSGANSFSVTTTSSFELADMISIGVTPTGDGILNVPAGSAAFSVATVNIGANRSINARPVYVKPFGEPAAQDFTGFICKTNPTTGACLAPPAASVTFDANPNVAHTFAVFVQRPANAPAFDPGRRRMLIEFRHMSIDGFFGQNALPVSVGSTSVAVRAQ